MVDLELSTLKILDTESVYRHDLDARLVADF